jgi:hypothetical protein
MPTNPPSKYDSDFEALSEARHWLSHINLRRHRGNSKVRAAVQNARAAVEEAEAALLDVERIDPSEQG